MASDIAPNYPPELTSEQAEYLLSNLKDWSILNGLAVRPSSSSISRDAHPSGSIAIPAPVTLFPSVFPRACFQEARDIQQAFNELYAAIASDEEWLTEAIKEVIEFDDFIAKLWDVHLAVKNEGYIQSLSLGLFRSDYLIHPNGSESTAKSCIKQVEFNTIASSFGGLASKVCSLHNFLHSINAYPPTTPPVINRSSFPVNSSIPSLSYGLALAHHAYGSSKSSPQLPLCILFVVQSPENNIFDQIALSTQLTTHHGIPNYRLNFSSILSQTSIPTSSSRALIYHPPHSPGTPYEVSLIYFRAGYTPSEYSSPASWSSRLQLERSAAIKCPSILTHLAGCKKIQQILATPGSTHVARFLAPHSPFLGRIQQTFTNIYPLDATPAGRHAIRLATDPETSAKYVLKPQREGGGNNIYGTKIPPFLKSLGDDERQWRAYILMELIEPPAVRNFRFRDREVKSGEVMTELGIFGVCLWNSKRIDGAKAQILENFGAGWLLRTKGRESEEGGVAAGFGVIDSVCLVDE